MTVEVGEPLTPAEVARFEPGTRVYLEPAERFLARICEAGFRPLVVDDRTDRTAATARRLAGSLADDRPALAAELGESEVADLMATISALADLLSRRRVTELTILAERVGGAGRR